MYMIAKETYCNSAVVVSCDAPPKKPNAPLKMHGLRGMRTPKGKEAVADSRIFVDMGSQMRGLQIVIPAVRT